MERGEDGGVLRSRCRSPETPPTSPDPDRSFSSLDGDRKPEQQQQGNGVSHATSNGEHLSLSCDVSKEQEVQRSFETIQKTCGSVSYLVNGAGINRDSLLLRTPPHLMVSMLHTNLLGSMLTCRAALRSLLRPPGGAIVNIGSVVGLKGNAGQSVYSASKSGLQGFTRSLAKEVASRSVRVNLLLPGFIRTNMTEGLEDSERLIPLRRFGTGQEVAQAVLFLLESQYMTGAELLVDGGLHLSM